MTATPSAPPNSRTVSLTAEPTPARAGGSVAMIISVAGGIAMPAPRPNSSSPMPVGTYEPPSTNAACTATPAGGDQRAGGDGDASAVHLGEVSAGSGAEQHPDRGRNEGEAGCQRRVLEDELQVLGLQEHGAGHGEEEQRERDASGGEAAVAEQRHVEHRVVAAHLPADEQRSRSRSRSRS